MLERKLQWKFGGWTGHTVFCTHRVVTTQRIFRGKQVSEQVLFLKYEI